MTHESIAILRSEEDSFRSSFVRNLIRGPINLRFDDQGTRASIPRNIVQFWDDSVEVPDDVNVCMGSWQILSGAGFALASFDDLSARRFVADKLESRHLKAFDACYHPAMRSDYFRLCYIGLHGGCYVDADDVYGGKSVDGLFDDGHLKLQPLCYDILSGAMVPPEAFTRPDMDSENWIFYFNNNPLIGPPGHPIVLRALERSTSLLNAISAGELPEIQSTTGPGNLTASVVAQALSCHESYANLALTVLLDWEQFATTVWPLSYRVDARNWRLSDRKRYLR